MHPTITMLINEMQQMSKEGRIDQNTKQQRQVYLSE